jgi:hypothetical protein
LRIFIKLVFLFIPVLLHGQEQIIVFSHDTLRLDNHDSIIYQRGNEFLGEIKYISYGYTSVAIIDSGYFKKRTRFYSNGIKENEYNYRNGKLNGRRLEWNDNGILILSGHYLNNNEDSVWTFYYSNGIKETEGSFLPDTSRLIDNFTIRQTQTNLDPPYDISDWVITSLKHSPPHGQWNFYNKRGQVIKTLVFDKGVLTSIQVGDNWNE